MRNRLIAMWLIILALIVIRRLVVRARGGWQGRFERMPDTSPPKWMFNNIKAIRENTDRILERLGSETAVESP